MIRLVLLLLVLSIPQVSAALTLKLSTSTVSCGVTRTAANPISFDTVSRVETKISAACDEQTINGLAIATVETVHADPSSVTASAQFSNFAPFAGQVGPFGGSNIALSNGRIDLQWDVTEDRLFIPPPLPGLTIPVVMTAFWQLDNTGQSPGNDVASRVQLIFSHITPVGQNTGGPSELLNVNGSRRGTFEIRFEIVPTAEVLAVPVDVAIEAGCSIRKGAVVAATCRAFIDPVIQFDQQLFDQRWGAQSFSLEDAFSINVSPNLVPEAATSILLGLTLAGLATRRRSHRRG